MIAGLCYLYCSMAWLCTFYITAKIWNVFLSLLFFGMAILAFYFDKKGDK